MEEKLVLFEVKYMASFCKSSDTPFSHTAKSSQDRLKADWPLAIGGNAIVYSIYCRSRVGLVGVTEV